MFPLFSGDCQKQIAQFPHFGITVFARNRSRQFREPKHPNFPNGPRPERICPCDAIACERQQIAALDGKEARGFVSRYKRFRRHSSQVRGLRSSNPTGLGRHFGPLSGRTRGFRTDQFRFRLVESVCNRQSFPTCFISVVLSNEFSGTCYSFRD